MLVASHDGDFAVYGTLESIEIGSQSRLVPYRRVGGTKEGVAWRAEARGYPKADRF